MAHIQTNIANFYSKLNEFRNEEKYVDVTIECENRIFKCHRTALASTCEYFDRMFCSEFREGTTGNVVLHEISAGTFEQVVQFAYTGDVVITSFNVVSLLRASEFFKLTSMENQCVDYIENNIRNMTVQSILNAYSFACKTKKDSLVRVLSRHIVDQFEIFSRVALFLEISVDDLKIILKEYSLLTARNEELLFGAIVRWVSCRREERSQYFDEFVRIVRFENMSWVFMRFLVTQLVTNVDSPTLGRIFKGTECDEVLEFQRAALTNREKTLHVYVQYPEENLMRVFSIDTASNCSISCEVHLNDRNQWIRTVGVNNTHLYCLKYYRENSKALGFDKQELRSYTSVDLHMGSNLKPPPLVFEKVSLCPLRNNIYVYKEDPFKQIIRTNSPSSVLFNDEEISRGVYVYNCEVDNWLPVPKMETQLQNSCITAYNDLLYFIGGTVVNGFNDLATADYTHQAYDHREGKWQKLLKKSHYKYSRAACCELDGNIYVCGGIYASDKVFEKYDTRAGKWEILPATKIHMRYHRLLSYSNKLWAMGSFVNDQPSNNLSIHNYDPIKNEWTITPILSETAPESTNCTILDSVIFKSL